MKFDEKLDVIRENVVRYVWTGTGEEMEAAKALETIFSTLKEIGEDYKALEEKKDHWLSEYVKLKR